MIMWRKHSGIETMGRGKFPTVFSNSKPCSPSVVNLELPTLSVYPFRVLCPCFFIHGDIFPWHNHLHALATISPTACLPAYLSFSFCLSLLSSPFTSPYYSFLVSFPSFFPSSFPSFQKSLGPCCPSDTMSFYSPYSPKLTYIQVLSRQMLISLLHLLFKSSFMLSVSLPSNSSAMLCL